MVMVVTDAEGRVLSETKCAGGSNNIAELCAVRDALRWCVDHGVEAVEIRTDSRNSFSWIFGTKVGKQVNDRNAVFALKDEISQLRWDVRLTLVWVGREANLAGHYIEQKYQGL